MTNCLRQQTSTADPLVWGSNFTVSYANKSGKLLIHDACPHMAVVGTLWNGKH